MPRAVVLTLAVVLSAGCATVTPEDSAWTVAASGTPQAAARACPVRADAWVATAPLPATRSLQVVSWNIHKNGDPGWERDLARLAADADLVLLQEAALSPELLALLARAPLSWIMADAWRRGELATGVLTAARAPATGACVTRALEPLLGVPKSALVTYYRLEGRSDLLAVANVHSVNFSLLLDGFRGQLVDLAKVLDAHRGPMIVAGDFNTWNTVRSDLVDQVTQGLGLRRADLADDRRTRFVGLPFDYLYARGLDVVAVSAEPLASSDHAPLLATLVLKPEAR